MQRTFNIWSHYAFSQSDFILVLCKITIGISMVFKNILLLMGSLGLRYVTELHVGVSLARIKNQTQIHELKLRGGSLPAS